MMHVLDVASREASRSGGAFALELLKYSYVSTCGDSHQLRCQWWAGFPDHDLLVIPGVVCRGLEGLARVELGYQQFRKKAKVRRWFQPRSPVRRKVQRTR